MKEQLITFETAKLAKEKGFGLEVRSHYSMYPDNTESELMTGNYEVRNYNYNLHYFSGVTEAYSAPAQSLLQKWLREKHNIHIALVGGCFELDEGLFWEIQVGIIGADSNDFVKEVDCTYEEALEKGLQEALKLIK